MASETPVCACPTELLLRQIMCQAFTKWTAKSANKQMIASHHYLVFIFFSNRGHYNYHGERQCPIYFLTLLLRTTAKLVNEKAKGKKKSYV